MTTNHMIRVCYNPLLFIIVIFCFSSYSFSCIADNLSKPLVWLANSTDIINNMNNNKDIDITTNTNRMMLRRLTKYPFELQLHSLARANLMLAMLANRNLLYCMSGRIKNPERESTSIFSQPVHLYPSLRLYYSHRADTSFRHLIDENGFLTSLEQLFTLYPNYILALATGRSYGSYLDKEIKKIPKKNITYRGGLNQNDALLAMLAKNRIDFVFAYPTIFTQNQNQNQNQKTIKNLHSVFVDKSTPFILGRVQCPKSPNGQKVINEVNRILDEMYTEPEFYRAHSQFLLQNDLELFKKNFTRVFVNREF